jgi:4,5-dihydroxyphthalate decarboxylase
MVALQTGEFLMQPLTIALGNYGITKPIKAAGGKQGRLNLDFVEVDQIVPMMRRMCRKLEFDICEMAFTTYVCARAAGLPFTAIPVFVTRNFHHWAVFINTKSGIKGPKDLEGRKVGVNRGYTVTTGVWARAILQTEHGVDLRKVTWVLSGDEHVAEYRAPENVVPIEPGKKMGEMLAAGELAAAIGVDIKHPDVAPLIPDALEAGLQALRARGHYPINHTVVIKDELIAKHPDLAADVFEAFAQAKRRYLERLEAGGIEQPTEVDEVHRRVMEIAGDPLPYGVAPNRKVLEELIGHTVTQGIIAKPVTAEALFAPSTHGLHA